MICAKCGCNLDPDDARQVAGRNLCEDCYMDALSPTKACDPWATYTASRLKDQRLNPSQETILGLIAQQGPVTLAQLLTATELKQADLEREMAALKHMELLRATPAPGGGKLFLGFRDPDPTWN
ncbi:Winged helix-turn-helix transcriptional regulator [Desulfarculales bacterium]